MEGAEAAAAAAAAAAEKTEALRRSERSVKRTKKLMEEELSLMKEKYESWCADGYNDLSAIEIKAILKEMKHMCLSYRKVSKELRDHLLAIKSISEANEAHTEEKDFTREVRETVRVWNEQVISLGEDGVSSIGSLKTTISSHSSANPMLNKYLDDVTEHSGEHEIEENDQRGIDENDQSQAGAGATSRGAGDESLRVVDTQIHSTPRTRDQRPVVQPGRATPQVRLPDDAGSTATVTGGPPGSTSASDIPPDTSDHRSVSVNTAPDGLHRNTIPQRTAIAPAAANPFTEVCVLVSPAATDITNHIVRTELYRNRNGLVPFDGSPHLLAGWVDRIKGKIRGLSLQPADILHLLEFHCTGEAKTYLNEISATTGHITVEVLNEIWADFKQRFASNNKIVKYFKEKVDNLPYIKGSDIATQLSTYHHTCKLISYNMEYCEGLKIYDLSQGMEQLRNKLPNTIKNRWRMEAYTYATEHGQLHPPFEVFVTFLKRMAAEYSTSDDSYTSHMKESKSYKVHKTKETSSKSSDDFLTCPFHDGAPHSIHKCTEFAEISYEDRKRYAADHGLCWSCLGEHRIRSCKNHMKCDKCGRNHCALMHNPAWSNRSYAKKDKSKDTKASSAVEGVASDCTVESTVKKVSA